MTEPKKKQTKETTRTGIESQKWRVISGKGEGGTGEKVQGITSIIGRYKIDRGRLITESEVEKPKNLLVRFKDMK